MRYMDQFLTAIDQITARDNHGHVLAIVSQGEKDDLLTCPITIGKVQRAFGCHGFASSCAMDVTPGHFFKIVGKEVKVEVKK